MTQDYRILVMHFLFQLAVAPRSKTNTALCNLLGKCIEDSKEIWKINILQKATEKQLNAAHSHFC